MSHTATDIEARLLERRVLAPPPHHVPQLGQECWLWTGATTFGYGVTRYQGQQARVHRLAFELYVGPIPDGMMVCHRCDVRNCFNPAHLFAGTRADNMQDMVDKGRSTAGVKHTQARLTDDQVQQIRRRHAAGAKQVDLASEFGVTKSQVSSIVRGKAWTHLLPPDFVSPAPHRWARPAA